MTNDPTTKSGSLVGVKVITSQFAARHSANGVDEVPVIKVFKPVLIRVVGVRPTMEVGSRRVFNPVFITSVLRDIQYT